jgi:hypothetical protein
MNRAAASTQMLGCLPKYMEDAQNTKRSNEGWTRPLWFSVAIISAVALLLCLWQWTRGHGHWDDILPSSALLLLALPSLVRIEGVTKYVLQFLGLGIAILAVILLSRSLGS